MRVKGIGVIPGSAQDKKEKIPAGGFPEGTVRDWEVGSAVKKGDKWILLDVPDRYINKSDLCGMYVTKAFNTNHLDQDLKKIIIDNSLRKFFSQSQIDRYLKSYTKGIFPIFKGYDVKAGFINFWISDFVFGGKEGDYKLTLPQLDEMKESFEKLYTEMENQTYYLEGEDQIKFKGYLDHLNHLSDEFGGFRDINLKIKETKKQIEEDWPENEMVKEIYKSLSMEAFSKYRVKYWDQIKDIVPKEQLSDAGVTLEDTPKTFYKKLADYVENNEDERVQEAIDLRIEKTTGKKLKGDWQNPAAIASLYNFEMFSNMLPKGHILNNDKLTTLKNVDYGSNDKGDGYACYIPSEKAIQLSKQAMMFASFGDLTKPAEFNSVFIHEVGHSVSKKLRDSNNYDYKVFTMLCGWDNRDREKLIATAGQADAPRNGRNQDRPLLTGYSHKSPEEAFAEYYAFYFLNKGSLDRWIDTNGKEEIKPLNNKTMSRDQFNLQVDMAGVDSGIKEELKEKYPKHSEEIINKLVNNKLDALYEQARKGILLFRNDGIPITLVEQNLEPLKQLKKIVFEAEEMIKSIFNDLILEFGMNLYESL